MARRSLDYARDDAFFRECVHKCRGRRPRRPVGTPPHKCKSKGTRYCLFHFSTGCLKTERSTFYILFSCISPDFLEFSNFYTKITCSKGWENVGKIFGKTCGKMETAEKRIRPIPLQGICFAVLLPADQIPAFLFPTLPKPRHSEGWAVARSRRIYAVSILLCRSSVRRSFDSLCSLRMTQKQGTMFAFSPPKSLFFFILYLWKNCLFFSRFYDKI